MPASVEHLAFLALPSKAGGLSIATASNLGAPPEQWTPTDFYGVARHVDDEAAFRDHLLEIAEHHRQLAALDRRRDLRRSPRLRGALPNVPTSMPRASSSIRRRAMAASISTRSATPSLLPLIATPADGMRRIASGRRLQLLSRVSSRRMSVDVPTQLCVTTNRTPMR